MLRRPGFTLIELLVVIAIIAILAAILFPVFAQAREKARQATCRSNLKQISLAAIMYAQDYDEMFPGNINLTNTGGNNQIFWWQGLPPYIQHGQAITNPYDNTANSSNVGGVFACPSAASGESLIGGGAAGLNKLNYIPAATVVEYNQDASTNGQARGGPALAAFSAPAQTAWLGDNGTFNKNNPNKAFLGRVMWNGGKMYSGVETVGGSVSATNSTSNSNPATAVFNVNEKAKGAGGSRLVSYRHSEGIDLAHIDGHVKYTKGAPVFSSVRDAEVHEISGPACFATIFDVTQVDLSTCP